MSRSTWQRLSSYSSAMAAERADGDGLCRGHLLGSQPWSAKVEAELWKWWSCSCDGQTCSDHVAEDDVDVGEGPGPGPVALVVVEDVGRTDHDSNTVSARHSVPVAAAAAAVAGSLRLQPRE
jgi:hypothetical protein